jgi:hypothetical protein
MIELKKPARVQLTSPIERVKVQFRVRKFLLKLTTQFLIKGTRVIITTGTERIIVQHKKNEGEKIFYEKMG